MLRTSLPLLPLLLTTVAWAAPRAAAAALELQWVKTLPARKPAWQFTPRVPRDIGYEPAASGGLVFIGCEHNNAILALDVETGRELWRFYANGPIRFAPLADGERVYVASDDGHLYCLDHAGRLLWKRRGGPSPRKVIGHERLISAWPVSARPALSNGRVFFVAGYWPIEGIFVHALDARSGERIWTNDAGRFRPFGQMRVLSETLFVNGFGGSGAFDVATGETRVEKPPKAPPPARPPVPPGVEGTVAGTVSLGGRLFVSTAEGGIYCFADKASRPAEPELPRRETRPVGEFAKADEILAATGIQEGYCLVLGLEDGELAEGLVRRSKLHVIAVDPHREKTAAIRRRLDRAGLFDEHRLAVFAGDPQDCGLPPYIASLTVSETRATLTGAIFRLLRPYGGTFVSLASERLVVKKREGPLPGAADWTHEFADEGNTLANHDTLIEAPLGMLWYGGAAADLRFYFNGGVGHDTRGDSVAPLPPNAEIIEGRMILHGPGLLAAVDIYTGRLLWESPIPKAFNFGGPGGGVGIHSRKYREPWKHPDAMKMEVPPTNQCRASGFNYVSVSDGIYVAAGKRCLRLDPPSGRLLSQWNAPLPGDLCWGNLRISGGLLIATAFRPQDIADAQAGHDGNGGDWAKDRMPMAHLFVVDRQSGELVWSRAATWSFLNQGIAVGGGKVFCVDLLTDGVLRKLNEAGRALPAAGPMLHALSLDTGEEKWSFPLDVLVKQLTYSRERDILLAPCRNLIDWKGGGWVSGPSRSRGNRNRPGRMRGFRGADGRVLWDVAEAPYFEPHIVVNDLIIDRYGHAYDLSTGERAERESPLTGRLEQWNFRKSGCNHLIACDNLVTWRTAVFDLKQHSGVMRLLGLDAGCTPTFVPAGGLLNAGNFGTHYKRSRTTALALVHLPENDIWTQYDVGKVKSPVPIRKAGFNFGAPGDRLAADGTLWLSVAPKKSANVAVQPKEVGWYQLHTTRTGSWIASSGIVGATLISVPTMLYRGKKPPAPDGKLRRYRVRLHFAEPRSLEPGDRVFSVSLEGIEALRDFDVVKEAGGAERPLVREFADVRVEGPIDITLSASAGETLLCGIEFSGE